MYRVREARRPIARVRAALVWLGLTACAVPARAQVPDVTRYTLEELLDVEVETVVGASKHVQLITEAPASVTIITADEIERHGFRDLTDVLRQVRGFYITSDRNYGYVGMRGFARPDDYNSRVIVLVDGHRLNDNVFGGVLIGQEFPVDLTTISRIEVIRGPGAALYGSNALFGIVNVVTKGPAEMEGGRALLEWGNLGTRGVTAGYGGTTPGGIEWVLSGTRGHSDGVRDLFYPEYADDPATGGHARDADATDTRRLFGRVRLGRWHVQALEGVRDKHVPTGSFGTIFGDTSARTRDVQGFVDINYDGAWRGATLGVRGAFDHYRYYGYYPYGDTAATHVINYDVTEGNWATGEVRLSKTLHAVHRVTAVTEVRSDFNARQQNFDGEVNPTWQLDYNHRSAFWSGYVQDEWRFAPGHLVEAGFRYDWYSDVGGQSAPRVALVSRVGGATTVKVVFGTAFRVPTVFERFYAQNDVSLPNPGLSVETSRTLEGVVEHYAGRWRLTGNVFFTGLRGVVGHGLTEDGLAIQRNLAGVDMQGVDVEAEGRWPSGISLRASQMLLRSRDRDTGRALANAPRAIVQAVGTVPLGANWRASAELLGVTTRRGEGGAETPGYVVLGAAVTRAAIARGLDLTLRSSNLLNSTYADPVGADFRQTSLPQNGRTVLVQLGVHF